MVNIGARAERIAAPAGAPGRASDEPVFKLISTTKSRREAQNLVRYVARVRKEDRDDPTVATVQLRDDWGEALTRARPGEDFEEARARADAAFEDLELPREEENLRAPLAEAVEAEEAVARAEHRVKEIGDEGYAAPEPRRLAPSVVTEAEAALRAHGVEEPEPASAQHQALALALLDAADARAVEARAPPREDLRNISRGQRGRGRSGG